MSTNPESTNPGNTNPENTNPDGWLDVTYPISEDMVSWPGQPPVSLRRLSTLEQGDTANVSWLELSLHTGTHMDAPRHFIEGGADITALPLSTMMGLVRVAEVGDVATVTAADVRAFETRSGAVRAGERVFFKTKNSSLDWSKEPFDKDYVALEPDAATYLAAKKIAVVGVDYLSVAPFDAPTETHRILLGSSVWVIEGLDLRFVDEGRFEMLALPLKIVTGDASPLRVLLRPLGEA